MRPALETHCFACHGGTKNKGGVSLARLIDSPKIETDFKIWERVADMIATNEMPPEDEPALPDATRTRLLEGIRAGLESTIEKAAGDPGRVTLRRLTSAEYAYTIEDLTGAAIPLDHLPENDAVGGEGFSNVGDVQFVQDSSIERYLGTAKQVAAHALIGAGPLRFLRDPGQTGQELFAIQTIKNIYERHGFRTGAGEGALAFGVEMYPRAFHAAWRHRHREALDLKEANLHSLAVEEGISPNFLQHIWSVLHDENLGSPSADIAALWRALPAPSGADAALSRQVRGECYALYETLRSWQTSFAANAGNDEEVPVLSETSFRPTLSHSFRARINWPRDATEAAFTLSVVVPGRITDTLPVVQWKNPRLRFRRAAAGGARTGRGESEVSLRSVLTPESASSFRFDLAPDGDPLAGSDFTTSGHTSLRARFPVPRGAAFAELLVEAGLDVPRGGDALVRCSISSPVIEGQGQTAAATGTVSALLANPDSPDLARWQAGAVELARKLPQVSHREPAPSDRDPIPAPYNNAYNHPERNEFHTSVKYHRDDRFLTEHILDESTRAELDDAWADLLSSFDYHDTILRFIARKFQFDLEGRRVSDLLEDWIATVPGPARPQVENLRRHHADMQRTLTDAQTGQFRDALRWAAHAWRRPLTREEQDSLRSFYSNLRAARAMDHAQALRGVLTSVLMSPAFLYRMEQPVAVEKSAGNEPSPSAAAAPGRLSEQVAMQSLTDWELASRLSYFLWSSIPDEPLRRAAGAGELRQPAALEAQARRMLRDPKARRLAAEFFGQWFGFYRFGEYRGIDARRFPEFTEELREALHDEAVSFFEHIVRQDRPVPEILFADYVFWNQRLARHYGAHLPDIATNALQQVPDAARFHRGGLLKLGSILTVTSAPLRTSPVKRGDWLLRRVLGTPVPPPPGDVGSITPDDVSSDGLTLRQTLEVHRSDASCVNCHSRMDPFGFALEQFDPIGRWRETYRDGQPVDTGGRLNDGTEITGLQGLTDYLRAHETLFRRTLCSKLLGFALGRAELVTDRPLLRRMREELDTDPRFSTLVRQIVTSTQFRFRRAEIASEVTAQTKAHPTAR